MDDKAPASSMADAKAGSQGIGMARFTEWAQGRVDAKRKRKGLGECKPRKNNAMRQIFANGACLTLANFVVGPLERTRILLQTAPMSTYQKELPLSARELMPYIVRKQGYEALWRGVMPHIYKQWLSVIVKVAFYDRIKNTLMPYSSNKYGTIDYFLRASVASFFCMGVMTGLTYPFDLLHTRLSADFTPKGRIRIYESTFQCFNKTNIDEGRYGCYKGVEFALVAGVIRACFQMPIYDVIQWTARKAGADPKDSMTGQFTQRVGASLVSGLLLSSLLYPLDTFKRASQLNGGIGYKQAFADAFECTQYMVKENKGNRGLYRGFSTFALAQVAVAFVQFSAFDGITAALTTRRQDD